VSDGGKTIQRLRSFGDPAFELSARFGPYDVAQQSSLKKLSGSSIPNFDTVRVNIHPRIKCEPDYEANSLLCVSYDLQIVLGHDSGSAYAVRRLQLCSGIGHELGSRFRSRIELKEQSQMPGLELRFAKISNTPSLLYVSGIESAAETTNLSDLVETIQCWLLNASGTLSLAEKQFPGQASGLYRIYDH
jgi:hypothetical protein